MSSIRFYHGGILKKVIMVRETELRDMELLEGAEESLRTSILDKFLADKQRLAWILFGGQIQEEYERNGGREEDSKSEAFGWTMEFDHDDQSEGVQSFPMMRFVA